MHTFAALLHQAQEHALRQPVSRFAVGAGIGRGNRLLFRRQVGDHTTDGFLARLVFVQDLRQPRPERDNGAKQPFSVSDAFCLEGIFNL